MPLRVGLFAISFTASAALRPQKDTAAIPHAPTYKPEIMPLTARLRDEENERINNILKRLIGTDYVPDQGNDAINLILKDLGFSLQSLLEMEPSSLVSALERLHFDWANAEQFADFVLSFYQKWPQPEFALRPKAIAIYEYVQNESKTFSLQIAQKIAAAKNPTT